jgi:hypothetical protein
MPRGAIEQTGNDADVQKVDSKSVRGGQTG